MNKIEVFDPAMCCSTGICGVDVDPKLVQFAADLDWLKEKGADVQRHNLGQEPKAFAENPAVLKQMQQGVECLPVILVNGEIFSTAKYPSREEFASRFGFDASGEEAPKSCCKCC